MRLRSATRRSATSLTIADAALAAPVSSARADDESLRPDLGARIVATVATIGSVFERTHNLVLNAMGFMGIPYKFGGSTPEAGFDCSGFVQYVVRQAAGLVLPRSSFDQIRLGASVARDELQPGDLVFFNTMRATASHLNFMANRFGVIRYRQLTNWSRRSFRKIQMTSTATAPLLPCVQSSQPGKMCGMLRLMMS